MYTPLFDLRLAPPYVASPPPPRILRLASPCRCLASSACQAGAPPLLLHLPSCCRRLASSAFPAAVARSPPPPRCAGMDCRRCRQAKVEVCHHTHVIAAGRRRWKCATASTCRPVVSDLASSSSSVCRAPMRNTKVGPLLSYPCPLLLPKFRFFP
jgi:hypothetical protein